MVLKNTKSVQMQGFILKRETRSQNEYLMKKFAFFCCMFSFGIKLFTALSECSAERFLS